MSAATAFAPVFAQVALTFALLLWTGVVRVRAVRSGEVRPEDIVLGQPNWPALPTQAANAFGNQFELPILFYVVVLAAFVTGHMTDTLLVLAWAFVATRLVHALIHISINALTPRSLVFATGFFILLAMWALFLVDVTSGPA